MKVSHLAALLLLESAVVAFPGIQQPTCAGKYGLLAGALKGYAPAASYCAKKYPKAPCTTTVTAKASTSTVTASRSVTVTGQAVVGTVTVSSVVTSGLYGHQRCFELFDVSWYDLTGNERTLIAESVTEDALSITETVTASTTIIPAPETITATVTTTSTDTDVEVPTITNTNTDEITITTTVTSTPLAKRSASATSIPVEDDPTLDAPQGLVERGDTRKSQWENCLKQNSWAAVSSVCNCLAPKTTITRTMTPKASTVTRTTTFTQTVKPASTITATALSTIYTIPTVYITATTILTQTITPEVSTFFATATDTSTASVDAITLTLTDGATVTSTLTIPTTTTVVTSVTVTVTVTTTPTQTPLAAGINVLQNPSFEDITASGPSGTIINWPNTGAGRVYPNVYQPAAQDQSTYAILNYNIGPAIMSQNLQYLDITSPYTLTFYYDLHSIVGFAECTLRVELGDQVIYTRTLTAAKDDPGPYNWKGPERSMAVVPRSKSERLSFEYDCVGAVQGAYSYIFLDNLFMTR